jgi:rare lipoprotein A (peptidoglycan hydrolase)
MKTGRNRPGRKDQRSFWRAIGERRRHLARRAVPAVLAAAGVALLAATAQAATGGASTATTGDAQASSDTAFAPMQWAGATWYGPGLYGSHTACGQVLRPHTIGVAHRSLPCGTTVKFVYRGRALVTQVIDRGPYSRGNSWDLTSGAAQALNFSGAGQGQLGYAVALEYAGNFHRAGRAGR